MPYLVHEGFERVPDVLRRVTVQRLRSYRVEVGKLVAVGLGDIEHVNDAKAAELLQGFLFTVALFCLRSVALRTLRPLTPLDLGGTIFHGGTDLVKDPHIRSESWKRSQVDRLSAACR